MQKSDKVKKNAQPYETYALAEDHEKDERTKATSPSVENVEQAKDFVDENKK